MWDLKTPKEHSEINWPLGRAAFVKVIHDFFPCTTCCGRVVIWCTFGTKKTKHTFIEVHWKKLFHLWQLFIFWKLISFCVNSFIVITTSSVLRIWVFYMYLNKSLQYYLFNTCIKSKREFGIVIFYALTILERSINRQGSYLSRTSGDMDFMITLEYVLAYKLLYFYKHC